METRTETVSERLLRELKEMTARHAMPPAIQQALKPLVPLAEQIVAGQDEQLRGMYQGACETIAKMHGAIVGFGNGPRRGLIEDVEDVVKAAADAYAARDKAQEDAGTLRRQLTETQEREAALAEKLEQIPVISPNAPVLELEQAKDVYAEGLALGMTIGKAEATGGVIPEKPVSVEELVKAKDAVERMIKRLQPEKPETLELSDRVISAIAGPEAPIPSTPDGGPVNPPAPLPAPGTVLGDCAPPKRSRRKES